MEDPDVVVSRGSRQGLCSKLENVCRNDTTSFINAQNAID
jgi:hypothetical protein